MADTLRILTVNLFNGRASPQALRAVLDRSKPDVVAAQEVGPNAAAALTELFPFGVVDPDTGYRGRALVAVHPIEPAELRLPDRPGLRARVRLDGAEISVLSVHLANPVLPRPSFRLRRAQVEALRHEIEGADPLVLVGDLNSTPLWPAYRRLTDRLTDGVAVWANRTGVAPPNTWGLGPATRPVLRIDHVLVRGVDVVEARTYGVAGTDHRALVADIRLVGSV